MSCDAYLAVSYSTTLAGCMVSLGRSCRERRAARQRTPVTGLIEDLPLTLTQEINVAFVCRSTFLD